MDETLLYVIYIMFERLENVILDYELFIKPYKWVELEKYLSERDAV